MNFINEMHNMKKLTWKIPLPNLTSSEFFLLSTLLFRCDEKDISSMHVSKIAKKMGISSPAVSKSLNSLEEKGFIERVVDADNRRNTRVKLTEKGERETKIAQNHINNYMDDVMVRMGKENLDKLSELLKMLTDTLEEKLSEEKENTLSND